MSQLKSRWNWFGYITIGSDTAIAARRPLSASWVAGGHAWLRRIVVVASTGLRRERWLGAQRIGIAHQAIDCVVDF
jgi:hypothetical protein